MSTYHSLCARLLRQFAAEAGLDPMFLICDDASRVVKKAADRVQFLTLAGAAAAITTNTNTNNKNSSGSTTTTAVIAQLSVKDMLARVSHVKRVRFAAFCSANFPFPPPLAQAAQRVAAGASEIGALDRKLTDECVAGVCARNAGTQG